MYGPNIIKREDTPQELLNLVLYIKKLIMFNEISNETITYLLNDLQDFPNRTNSRYNPYKVVD